MPFLCKSYHFGTFLRLCFAYRCSANALHIPSKQFHGASKQIHGTSSRIFAIPLRFVASLFLCISPQSSASQRQAIAAQDTAFPLHGDSLLHKAFADRVCTIHCLCCSILFHACPLLCAAFRCSAVASRGVSRLRRCRSAPLLAAPLHIDAPLSFAVAPHRQSCRHKSSPSLCRSAPLRSARVLRTYSLSVSRSSQVNRPLPEFRH